MDDNPYERDTKRLSDGPVLFRQLIFSEFITPTKNVRNFSFRMGTSDKWSPVSKSESLSYDFSLETNSNSLKQSEGNFPLVPIKTLPESLEPRMSVSCNVLDDNFKSHRQRGKLNPPLKKIKYDNLYEHTPVPNGRVKSIKRRRQSTQKLPTKELHFRQILLISFLPLLAILGVLWFILPTNNILIEEEWSLQPLSDALKAEVFGQKFAVASVVETIDSYFQRLSHEKEVPVILFSGPNGVGKSLISTIIAANFPPPGKTEIIFMPLLPNCDSVLKSFSGRGPHLVIVDDLNPLHVTSIVEWTKHLTNEALWLDKRLMIILIFNVQPWTDDDDVTSDDEAISHDLRVRGNNLHLKFNSSGLSTHHIHFSLLSKENVKDCIRRALKKQGWHLVHERHVELILQQFDYMTQGCKPVWSNSILIDFNEIHS